MPSWPEWVDLESRKLAIKRAGMFEIVDTFFVHNRALMDSPTDLTGMLQREALKLRVTSPRPFWLPLIANVCRTVVLMIPTALVGAVVADSWFRPVWQGDRFGTSDNAIAIFVAFGVLAGTCLVLQVAAEFVRWRRDDLEDQRSVELQLIAYYQRAVQHVEDVAHRSRATPMATTNPLSRPQVVRGALSTLSLPEELVR